MRRDAFNAVTLAGPLAWDPDLAAQAHIDEVRSHAGIAIPIYSERLFLKALVIMMVRHLHKVHELLAVLAEPTPEMQTLRPLLVEHGCFPTRRTWERRLKAMPASLPAFFSIRIERLAHPHLARTA